MKATKSTSIISSIRIISLLGCDTVESGRNLVFHKHLLPLSSNCKDKPQIAHSSVWIFHLSIHASWLWKVKCGTKHEANSPFCWSVVGCGMRLTEVKWLRYLCMSSKSTGGYVRLRIWSAACKFVWVNVECLLKKLGSLQHKIWSNGPVTAMRKTLWTKEHLIILIIVTGWASQLGGWHRWFAFTRFQVQIWAWRVTFLNLFFTTSHCAPYWASECILDYLTFKTASACQ